jgi:hypothetical protein
MSRTRKAALLTGALAAAVAAYLAPASANAPTQVGIAAAVLNRVTIARGGAAQMRPAVLRQQVALADRVETGARSQLQILLLDRSTFTVGANARLSIDRFVYDPAQGRSMSASVAKGAFRFMSGRPSRSGASSITTPVASIGIRGTIVDGVVGADAITIASGECATGGARGSDPQTATLIVLRGPGANTRGNVVPGAISVSAGGKTVALERPLQAVYVPRAGAQPIGPFAISLSGLTRLQGLIFPSLAEWRLATLPPPNSNGPMPVPQRRQRPRPALGGDPDDSYGGEPMPGSGTGPGGMIPSYGSGIPSMPSMPRRSASSPQQDPPARTATTRQETVPASEPAPAADPPRNQEPTPPPADQAAPEPAPQAPPPTYDEPTPAPTSAPPPPPPPPEPDYPPTTSTAPPPTDNYPSTNYNAPNQAPPPRTTSGKN